VFHPNEADASKAWQHFSNTRVGDLAFGPDGRLWGVRWSGSTITAADPNGSTEIVSFPMSGKTVGRAELEYRLTGVVSSIAFGQAGTPLAGLLFASGSLAQHVTVAGVTDTTHGSTTWMIELDSRRVLQLAGGGTQAEAIVATSDGRILVAQTNHVDEIAPAHAPKVVATSVPDGALVPLPLSEIAVVFDQDMWTGNPYAGTTSDATSVLDAGNFTLLSGEPGAAGLHPAHVRWDALTHTAYLDVSGLVAGHYQLTVAGSLRSSTQLALGDAFVTGFTALLDMTTQVSISFDNVRSDHTTGAVSYDVTLTNISGEDLRGPLVLLLDPGAYFGQDILGALPGSGNQADLWTLDLTAALAATGGRLLAGATLGAQTITVVPASHFGGAGTLADLAKFNLGHGIYAVPLANLPPTISSVNADSTRPDIFPAPATAGTAWSATVDAIDADGTRFYWEVVQAPAGLTLSTIADTVPTADGRYLSRATLTWTPGANAPADAIVVIRVQDGRGGVALRTLHVPVTGGNHPPALSALSDTTIAEGSLWTLPLGYSDTDGDKLTVSVSNLPPGAVFDASSGSIAWIPGYDQAGIYRDITIRVSDGKTEVSGKFTLTVTQTLAAPVMAPLPSQTLREGDAFAMQLNATVPGGLGMADGTKVVLTYGAPVLPVGMTLNTQTGWLSWTPGFAQHGDVTVNIVVTATYTRPDGSVATRNTIQPLVLKVLNANGAPAFDASVGSEWNLLEGQPLRISVFAFDPDNPGFAPKIRLGTNGATDLYGSAAASVTYTVTGLPDGATFDPDTLEILWTPTYAQAGSYCVTVVATDDGDGTGVPAVSRVVIPIVVANANRAPVVAPIANAFVDKGATLDIPFSVTDADGNPIDVTVAGLPAFATYTQTVINGRVTGTIHFAPGDNSRGDYTISVTAKDDGDGDPARVLSQTISFVLTVRSPSEPPVFVLPAQVVVVAGQTITFPVSVSDLDQDALTFAAEGLPAGATLTPTGVYGQAVFSWTPSEADLGAHDVVFVVSDSGLAPEDAGHTQPSNPVPNVVRHTVRVVVRDANQAPALLGVQVNGHAATDPGDAAVPLAITANEGVPLSLDLFAHDADADIVNWTVTGVPAGMRLSTDADGGHAQLLWTPGLFAAGTYRFSVTGSDGAAQFTRSFEVHVANVDQAPTILPLPLQLVDEGSTIGFSLRTVDADGDAIIMSMIYDENTPAGVSFNPATGYFEWSPGYGVVDNASAGSRDFTFSFRATDGVLTSTQTVHVRVFDVNRVPVMSVSSHAVVVGQSLVLPVVLGTQVDGKGIVVSDPDGAAQTAALLVSFVGLPDGATYDVANGRLTWTPGPGQIGDFVVTARVSDGKAVIEKTFTLRVVTDATQNAPAVLVDAVPGTPTVPGQSVLVTVRSSAYSPVVSSTVEVRGAGLGQTDWTALTLDSSGRARLTSLAPGLIEVRVTVTDADGFSTTTVRQLLVKDPSDTQAPVLAWDDVLEGATAQGKPVTVVSALDLSAYLADAQLMGYRLELAPAGTDRWQTITSRDIAADAIDGTLSLASFDPALWNNGVYQLRLTAWDLAGRTSEIDARLIVDTDTKTIDAATSTDGAYVLGGHTFNIDRSLTDGSMGNWTLDGMDTSLSSDQEGASGSVAWREGARLWLDIPASPEVAGAPTRHLSFTLSTVATAMHGSANAPVVYGATFGSDQGWTLAAEGGTTLQRQGGRLYDQVTGLPWSPSGYVLTSPEGTRYHLDAAGKITSITFADNVRWLVSDTGIALDGGDANARMTFLKDSLGRIVQIAGPSQSGGELRSVVYRYDAQGRLLVVRPLDADNLGTPYGYDAQGKPYTDTITANLGTAANWLGNASANTWSGELGAEGAAIGFTVRDSEVASAAHVAGATGSLIIAIALTSDSAVDASVAGGEILGSTVHNGVRTILVRVTESGLKLLRLSGTGHVSVTVTIAADFDHNGAVDGSDAAAFAAALVSGSTVADINGDGVVDATDRQILYANYGWRANSAPRIGPVGEAKTHTDLPARIALDDLAADVEGDAVFWRITGVTGGTARLAADGKTLIFTPTPGFSGKASVTLMADDGFSSSAPITLTINVSDAKLTLIDSSTLGYMAVGTSFQLGLHGEFADESGVLLTPGYLSYTSSDPSIVVVDANGVIRIVGSGHAVIYASGHGLSAALAVVTGTSDEDEYAYEVTLDEGFDVYPGSVSLVEDLGTRQVRINAGSTAGDQSAAGSGVIYRVQDPSVATVTADGLIVAKGPGFTIVSVIRNGLQRDIEVRVAALPAIGTQDVAPAVGAIVNGGDGLVVQIPPDSLPAQTKVSLSSVASSSLPMAPPAFPDGFLQAGAFDLEMGSAQIAVPVQLSMPAPAGASIGDTVYFYKYTIFLNDQGVSQGMWLAVESGTVGADGMVHTASPPYAGIANSGFYVAAVKKNPDDGSRQVVLGIQPQLLFNPATNIAMMAGGLVGAVISLDAIAMGASNVIAAYAMRSGITYQSVITIPVHAAGTPTVNLDALLPPVQPSLSFAQPVIDGVSFDDDGNGDVLLKITGSHFGADAQPNVLLGPMKIRITSPDGSSIDMLVPPGSISGGTVTFRLPSNLPLAGMTVSLVRVVQQGSISNSGASSTLDTELVSGTAKIQPRRNLTIIAQNDKILVLQDGVTIRTITHDQTGQANLNMVGWRVDSVVFSADNARAYVAGQGGRIYAIDTATLSVFDTFSIPGASAAMNITSLALAGNGLFVALGDRYGTGSEGLYRFDVDPFSATYNRPEGVVQIKLGDNIPYGVYGMAVGGGGGRYLIVTAPQREFDLFPKGADKEAGNVLVIDLQTLDGKGNVSFSKVEGFTGVSPLYIQETTDRNRFIVSNSQSFNDGIATITLENDPVTGNLKSAKASTLIEMAPQGYTQDTYWQNINQASGVVVTSDLQYAFVADYNLSKQKLELGGDSDIINQLMLDFIGGKIGVIKDPFGLLGAPVYLGATTPIDEGLLSGLAITPDGKYLYAQLLNADGPSGVMRYTVDTLIRQALDADRTGHKDRPIDYVAPGAPAPADIATLYPIGFTYGVAAQAQDATLANHSVSNIDSYTDPNTLLQPTFTWSVTDPDYHQGDDAEAMLYVSVFGPTNGLFPNGEDPWGRPDGKIPSNIFDYLPGIEDSWEDGTRDANAGRTLTVKVKGQYIDGKLVFTFDTRSIPGFGLTASQQYFWGVQYDSARSGERVLSDSWSFTTPSLRTPGQFAAVTVVTHGYQPATENGFAELATGYTIARELAVRTGGGLFVYEPVTGQWMEYDASDENAYLAGPKSRDPKVNAAALENYRRIGAPVFLVSDWYAQSGMTTTGFSEAAADAIFASLLQLGKENLNNTSIQLIGHSRGTVVNSEIAQRILQWGLKPKDLQMTDMDIHDFSQKSLNIFKLVNDDFDDANVLNWAGIQFEDNYYERQANEGTFGLTLNPNGRSMYDAGKQPQIRNDIDPTNYIAKLSGGNKQMLSNANIDFDMTLLPGFTGFDGGFMSGVNARTAQPHSITQTWYLGTAALNIPGAVASYPNGTVDYDNVVWRRFADSDSLVSLASGNAAASNNFLPWYISGRQSVALRGTSGNTVWTQSYQALIANSLELASSISFEGGGEGWFYSVLGGGYKNRPPLILQGGPSNSTYQTDTNQTKTDYNNSERPIVDVLHGQGSNLQEFENGKQDKDDGLQVFNGTFEQSRNGFDGRFLESYDIPGWSIDNGTPYTDGNYANGHDHRSTRAQFLDLHNNWSLDDFQYKFKTAFPALDNAYGLNLIKQLWTVVATKIQPSLDKAVASAYSSIVNEINAADLTRGKLDSLAFGVAGTTLYKSVYAAIQQTVREMLASGLGTELNLIIAQLVAVTQTVDGFKDLLGFDLSTNSDLAVKDPLALANDPLTAATMYNVVYSVFKANSNGDYDLALALSRNSTVLTHDRMAVPNGAQSITFQFSSTAVKPGSKLLVYWLPMNADTEANPKAVLLGSFDMNQYFGAGYVNGSVNLNDPGIAGSIRFELQLADGDSDATVLLDNLKFSRSAALPEPFVPFVSGAASTPATSTGAASASVAIPSDQSVITVGSPSVSIVDSRQETSPANELLVRNASIEGPTAPMLATGWVSHGDVTINDGTLLLSEDASAQTRVHEVLVVGENDQLLTFTVDGLSLGSSATGPSDTFEVALLDALSGVSLAGDIGLSQTDAALNVQASGKTFIGQGLTVLVNADGSRTYTLDLRGIAVGTAIALEFDILGFGEANSHVTVRDVAMARLPVAHDDTIAANEDAPASIDLRANDGNTAGFVPVVIGPPSHGHVDINPDGSITYVPETGYVGSDTFTYLLRNGSLDSNVASVLIQVAHVNHVPVAEGGSVSVQEGGSAIVDLIGTVSDADGDALSVHIVSQPTHGSLSHNADGTWTYTPTAGFYGGDSFTYVANDGESDSATATILIDVVRVNHAPTVGNASLTTMDNAPLSGNVLGYASDTDGDSLVAELVGGPANGTLTFNADGSFVYTPSGTFHGNDSFTYRVSDGVAFSMVGTITIAVTSANHAPVAKDIVVTIAEGGSTIFLPAQMGSDADGNTLKFWTVDKPAHGSFIQRVDGGLAYHPDAYYNGSDTFTFVLYDGKGGFSNTGHVTLTVTPVNNAPVAVNDSVTMTQGQLVVIPVLANDSDIDNSTGQNAGAPKPANAGLTARIIGLPVNGTVRLNSDGTIRYVPRPGFYGTDSFTYVANDGALDSAVATVTITVQRVTNPPVAVDDTYTATEGTALVLNPVANDTGDGDDLPVTAVVVTPPQHGRLIRNADGSLTYLPDAGFVGTDTLTYQAESGDKLSNVATVRLIVSSANHVPVAGNDTARIHNNQTAIIDVLANDRDADGDALKATLINGPKHGTLARNADGSFSYTADCLFTGTDTFTYIANDGKADSITATVTISVLGPNLPPLAFDDVVDLKENGAIRIDPTGNDWDINGDDLKALLVCGPSHGSLSLNTDGTYTYTPDANWYGLDGFTYQAYDGQFRSNPAMVWIRVAHVNQAPVASADAFTVRAGQATRLDVLANDNDIDGDDITSKLTSSPRNGTLTRNRDGSFSYTAKSGFVGIDTFTYDAADGALESKPVTVTITVLAPNHAPIARDDKATTNAGAAVRIDALANDTDPDGDRLSALIVCAPSHGKLTINPDGSYSYTPDKGWYGTDSFSYRATDGEAQSGVAMVCVTVQKVNRAPTAQNASFQVQKDGSVRIDFDGLVDDPDGDALTLSLTNPSKGTLTRNRDGSYTYKPKAGFTGTDGFAYSVSDGKLSASATITLAVSKNPPCGNAMTILFGASGSSASAQSGGYIVVNLGAASQPVIDWSGSGSPADASSAWWSSLGGEISNTELLSIQTGLVLRRD